jgi:hypothetical protein
LTKFGGKIHIIEGVPSLSALSPLVTSFLNAAAESQKFAGVIDSIKLVRTHQTNGSAWLA